MIDAEPAQTVLAGLQDPAPRQTTPIRIAGHRVADLGGQHDPIAMTTQRLTENGFGHAVVVHIGGVEQGDAGVECTMHHPVAFVDVVVAPAAEHHRSERERADPDTAVAERTELLCSARPARHTKPAWRWKTRLSQ